MSSNRYFICILLTLMLAVAPSLAGEEGIRESGAYDLDGDALCYELVGKRVRVSTRSQGEIEGRLIGCVRDSIYVVRDAGTPAVSLQDIEALWMQGGGVRESVVAGAITGAAGGGALMVIICAVEEADGSGSPGACALAGAALGSLIGCSIGAVLGASSSDWHLWYGSEVEPSAGISVHPHYLGTGNGLGLAITYRF